jgi:hypothetical protein
MESVEVCLSSVFSGDKRLKMEIKIQRRIGMEMVPYTQERKRLMAASLPINAATKVVTYKANSKRIARIAKIRFMFFFMKTPLCVCFIKI